MTYHIITIGCQMNKSDSERLGAYLETNDYQAVADFKLADLVIINTCGVRQAAEDRAYGLANQIKKFNSSCRLIITGCLSQRQDVKRRLAKLVDLFLPIAATPNLLKLLQKSGLVQAKVDGGRKINKNNRKNKENNNLGTKTKLLNLTELRELSGEKYLTIISKYENKFSAYVPIGNGCNNFCSYCVVPYARGPEVYRPVEDILREVKALIKAGYKEIILIAQNVNSYQVSRKTKAGEPINFAKLLRLLSLIPGKFWLRFSSSHPKDLSDELIKVIGSSPKICRHLHIAVQSGDNQILRAMNRKYTVEKFSALIKKIRAAKPGIAISTDIIVGFPGETKDRFQNSVKLFKNLQFDLAYISPYSPRSGTAAYNLKDNISALEKNKRAKILNEILKKSALAKNREYLGREVEVLVEGRNRAGDYLGRTDSYKLVSFGNKPRLAKDLIGQFVKVKIKTAKSFGLEGELVKKRSL
ncbi:MAG: tRNA (N6-isopentenyl adenosine(37)-C2)-methylthiotransferase MiaB [Candidatus Falkowbacteria bacterium]|nr:tRNA (N6-isopentenyl adenosine(37)-C2)-methylthiotransferase MiaB [Candidatus Falkowbacteria bacterium]